MIILALNLKLRAKMRKYLTRNSDNAFTILVPRNTKTAESVFSWSESDYLSQSDRLFLKRFEKYYLANSKNDFAQWPVFNWLAIFYNVSFVKETEEFVELNLMFNETLNKNIWLRLRHAIFNQYNALIGFSEVLKDVEELEDADRLMIERINFNARDLFNNSKLLMEFEQLKAFSFELETRMAQPLDHFSSFISQSNELQEKITFEYDNAESENLEINIESPYFKTSLNLLFNILKEVGDLSNVYLKFNVKRLFHISIEFRNTEIKNDEYLLEIRELNDFFNLGIDLKPITLRVFHLMYIRLVAEKLGGAFNIHIDESAECQFSAEWIFPFVEAKEPNASKMVVENSKKKKSIPSIAKQKYSKEMKKELADNFIKVEETYLLDDWRTFADLLDMICIKYKVIEKRELEQITHTIRAATDAFDIKALQSIKLKIKQIVETE